MSVGASHFSIIPNPTNGLVLVQLQSEAYEEKLDIKLFDLTGRSFEIQKHRIDNLSWQLDLSNLPAGSYLLGIFGKNYAHSQIIIKF